MKLEKAYEKYHQAEMRLEQLHKEKFGGNKTFRKVVLYNDTERNEVCVRIDKTEMSAAEYKQNKPRGILHKLDSRFQTENISILYPFLKRGDPIVGGGVNMNYKPHTLQIRTTEKSKLLTEINNFAGLKANALAIEDAVLKFGDAAKDVSKPVGSIVKGKITNSVYRAGQQETGMRAVTITGGILTRTYDVLGEWKAEKKHYKLEVDIMKAEKEKGNLDKKIYRKVAKKEAKETKDFLKEQGLDKPTKEEIKNAKRYKVEKENPLLSLGREHYIDKPDKYKAFKLASKSDRLKHKEWKYAKKAYGTRTVKEHYINSATGKMETRKKTIIDTTKLKTKKPKKPTNLASMSLTAGLGSARDAAFSKLSTQDDTGAQAVGKGLQFTANEMHRMKQANIEKSKLKFDKKIEHARVTSEKAHNKLMFEESKPKKEQKKKDTTKKARKKTVKKKQNKNIYDKAKEKAQKAAEKVADGIKNFVKSKGKYAAVGLVAGVIAFILPFTMVLSMLGAGGGSGAEGAFMWLQNDKTLTEVESRYSKAIALFAEEKKKYVQDLDDAAVKALEEVEPSEENDYTVNVVRHSLSSFSIPVLRYDVFKLLSYLSAKYRTTWTDKEINEEFAAMVVSFYDFYEFDLPYTFTLKNGTLVSGDDNNSDTSIDENDFVVSTDESSPAESDNSTNSDDSSSTESGSEDKNPSITYKYTIHLYGIRIKPDLNKDTYLDDYIKEHLEGLYVAEDTNRDDGLEHYDTLIESEGGHQRIKTPLPDMDGWNKKASLYPQNAEQSRKPIENCVGVDCSKGTRVVAGADGTVKSIGGDHIQIEYEHHIVTYYTGGVSTEFAEGSTVKENDLLFKVGDKKGEYSLQMSVYEKSSKTYINPLFVLEGRKGLMDGLKKKMEDAVSQAVNG